MGNICNRFKECLYVLFYGRMSNDKPEKVKLLQEDYFVYNNPILSIPKPKTNKELLEYYKVLKKFENSKRKPRKQTKPKKIKKKKRIHSLSIFGKKKINT